MTIELNQLTDDSSFDSVHAVDFELNDGKHFVQLTGVAILLFKGTGGEWHREDLSLFVKLPPIIPEGKSFKVEQFAPFVTLNSISNQQQAVNAGWAVDTFDSSAALVLREQPAVPIRATLAVRDIDGFVLRVGYSISVVGAFVPESQPRRR